MQESPESLNTHDDAELLRRMAAGDESALASLYDRYGGMLYAVGSRMARDAHVAEEAVQNTFLSAWRNAASFDARRGKASTWLVAILKNQIRDYLRKHKRRDAHVALWEMGETDVREIVDQVDRHLLAGDVRDAVCGLPREQRIVVHLIYFYGLTHRQAAERLNIPLGTVKSRLRLAIERLGTLMDNGPPNN